MTIEEVFEAAKALEPEEEGCLRKKAVRLILLCSTSALNVYL